MIYGLPSSAYEKSIVCNLVLNSDKFFPCTQTAESLGYIFVADSMGLSSFKYSCWALKDARVLKQSA